MARTDCTSGDAASYNPLLIRCVRTAPREGHCWCAPPYQCSAGSTYYGCDSPGASCLSTNLQPSTPPTNGLFQPFIQVELSGTVRVLNVTFNGTISSSTDSRLNFKSAVSERALLVGEITAAQLLAVTLEQRRHTSFGVATVAVTASMVFDDTVTIARAQVVAASYVSVPVAFQGKGYRAVRTSVETHNYAETTQSSRPTASRVTFTAPSVAPAVAPVTAATGSTTAAATESNRAASVGEDEEAGILIAVVVVIAVLLVIIVIWRASASQQTQSTNLAQPPAAAPTLVNMASFSLEGDNLDVTKTVTSFNNPVYAPYIPVQPSMGMPGNPSPIAMGTSSSMTTSAPLRGMPPLGMGMGGPMSAPPTANAYAPGPMMPGGTQMSFVGTPGGLPYWRQ